MSRGRFGYGNFGNTEFLGKKVVNKTMDLFNRKQVVIAGDNADKKAKAELFRASLGSATVPQQSDAERAGFNVKLPKIYEALLKTDASSYIASIGPEDVNSLPEIGIKLAIKEISSEVVFRVVFGATEQMPLRAISYLLPPLLAMERIQVAEGTAPQLQVVFARHITSRLNRLDPEKVFGQSLEFARIAKYYVGEFFPQLDESTVFLEDTPLNRGTFLRKELVELADKFSNIPEELKSAVSEKGEGSGRLNRFYAAAHVLMHDRDGLEYLKPIIPDQEDPISASSIVSFGGLQENLFYRVRHGMKPYLGSDYNSVNTFQYFTRHHVPPYYMAKGGDIALSASSMLTFSGNEKISVSAMRDLDFYRQVTTSRGIHMGF